MQMGAGFKISAMVAAIYLSWNLYRSLIAVIVVLLVIIVVLVAALIYTYARYKSPRHRSSLTYVDETEIRRLEKALQQWVEEKRYRECDLNREDIALQLNTSKEFLNAYFSSALHVDFNTWRTTLRVEDAKIILLDQKDLPINLVGEMVGFSDRSNFHRQFTRLVGCTPKQWRNLT